MINAPPLACFMFECEGRSCAPNPANSDRERAKLGRKIVGLVLDVLMQESEKQAETFERALSIIV